MIRPSLVLLLVALVISVIGCATIMHGSKHEIAVTSVPSGASVLVQGVVNVKTPGVLKLERGKTHTVTFEKEGYQPVDFVLTRKLSNWVWGNIVFGGLVGLVVDFATGAAYDLNPDQLLATLDKINISNIEADENHLVVVWVDAENYPELLP